MPKRPANATTPPRAKVGKRKDGSTPEELLQRRDQRRAIALAVFEDIADGALVREATARAGLDQRTLRHWINEDRDYLAPLYAQAREEAADALAEEAQAVAAGVDALGVTMQELAEREIVATIAPEQQSAALRALESARVQRDRLRVDTLKWTASKRRPRYYGDKMDLTSGGEQLAPAVVLMPALDAVPLPSAGDTMIGADAIDQRPPATRPDLKALLGKRA